jgi:hypothetical protein
MTKETNEIIEASKATQELAKTSTKALETAEKLGGFISTYIGGPLEQAMGIFEDKLKYIRWERQERLFLRAEKFLKEEGSARLTRPLPLKYAVPLLSAASLEDDDGLQDVWAKLLLNFTIETSSIEASRTYIDILERLSPLEVQIINAVYALDYDLAHHNGIATRELPDSAIMIPEKPDEETREAMKIEPKVEVKLALANLDRLGIVAVSRSMGGGQLFGSLNPNLLGKAFHEACTLPSEK